MFVIFISEPPKMKKGSYFIVGREFTHMTSDHVKIDIFATKAAALDRIEELSHRLAKTCEVRELKFTI